jgi:hypothetical protein
MAITLYDATVPQFLQVLGGLRGCLDKGLEFARAKGIDPEALVEARLAEDMFPLFLQVQLVAHHSAGALRDVKSGGFTFPPRDRLDYPGMQKLLADSEAAVRGWSREAVDALEGREVTFDAGEVRRSFTAEGFLSSFSMPNFYFHAVTAYDILRAQGAPVGKRDYLGEMRMKL